MTTMASDAPRYAAVTTSEPLGDTPPSQGGSETSSDGNQHDQSDDSCSSSSLVSGETDEEEEIVVEEGRHRGGGSLLPSHVDGGDLKESDELWDDEGTFSSTPSAFLFCAGLVLTSISMAGLFTGLVVKLSGGGGAGDGSGIFGLRFGGGGGKRGRGSPVIFPEPRPFPQELLDDTTGAYDVHDFVNSDGRTPPFWDNVVEQTLRAEDENLTMSTHWGPCLPPMPSPTSSPPDWPALVHWNKKRQSDADLHYPVYHRPRTQGEYDSSLVPWGLCRPGFLIIGAGKCGTSSLYHYLVGHDRVLPANEKQIHYFKYHPQDTLSWYFSHFPSTETFLASGALMTGEASPGYLPYPSVPRMAALRLPGPKIITIAREPLDRAWSSYKYNYVSLALEKARKGRLKERGVPKGMSKEYYRENHLFSFEEMLRAELVVLKECLKEGGIGETETRKTFGKKKWVVQEFQKRDQEGLPPLVDMDEFCYGKKVSSTVPRAQWSDLVKANPQKIIQLPNLHLVQSFIGRSLYVLPLEWWYVTYPAEDIYLVCNEDMRENAAQTVGDLSKWLGLPDFDFTDVVSEGMYNVGGHRGYDLAIPWNETDSDLGEGDTSLDGNNDGQQHESHQEQWEADIPVSEELRQEILDFVRPHNERLFELTGRRCNWL